MAVNIGDRVRFLNSIGGGIVKKIADGIAHVEDEDGFVTPVLVREVVVVAEAASQKAAASKTEVTPAVAPLAPQTAEAPPKEELDPYVETPEGEKLNLVLAFVPADLKALSSTNWESYIINDSNYWLSFVLMSHGREEKNWSLLCSKTVEPGTLLFINEIEASQLSDLERVRLQCMAYKTDSSFEAKKPFDITERIDGTKFFKLHCYKPSVYFEEPVLSFELVKDDVVAHEASPSAEKLNKLEKEFNAKKASDLRPTVKHIKKRTVENDPMAPIIVDLHIEELVDNVRGMKPADILNRQVDEFRAVMDANKGKKGKKIIFIHGKGEGVLKNALMKELNHSYKGNDVQDASFREYGFGATQVTIR